MDWRFGCPRHHRPHGPGTGNVRRAFAALRIPAAAISPGSQARSGLMCAVLLGGLTLAQQSSALENAAMAGMHCPRPVPCPGRFACTQACPCSGKHACPVSPCSPARSLPSSQETSSHCAAGICSDSKQWDPQRQQCPIVLQSANNGTIDHSLLHLFPGTPPCSRPCIPDALRRQGLPPSPPHPCASRMRPSGPVSPTATPGLAGHAQRRRKWLLTR